MAPSSSQPQQSCWAPSQSHFVNTKWLGLRLSWPYRVVGFKQWMCSNLFSSAVPTPAFESVTWKMSPLSTSMYNLANPQVWLFHFSYNLWNLSQICPFSPSPFAWVQAPLFLPPVTQQPPTSLTCPGALPEASSFDHVNSDYPPSPPFTNAFCMPGNKLGVLPMFSHWLSSDPCIRQIICFILKWVYHCSKSLSSFFETLELVQR